MTNTPRQPRTPLKPGTASLAKRSSTEVSATDEPAVEAEETPAADASAKDAETPQQTQETPEESTQDDPASDDADSTKADATQDEAQQDESPTDAPAETASDTAEPDQATPTEPETSSNSTPSSDSDEVSEPADDETESGSTAITTTETAPTPDAPTVEADHTERVEDDLPTAQKDDMTAAPNTEPWLDPSGWWFIADDPYGYYTADNVWVDYDPNVHGEFGPTPVDDEYADDDYGYDEAETEPEEPAPYDAPDYDNVGDDAEADDSPELSLWSQSEPQDEEPITSWDAPTERSDTEQGTTEFFDTFDTQPDTAPVTSGEQPNSVKDDPFASYTDGTRKQPAPQRGWRKLIHTLTGGAITPKLSADEQEELDLRAAIDRPVKVHRVTFSDSKGGVGKSTATLLTGTAFAQNRRDNTVALDANPDFGTLAYRAGQENSATVRDMVNNLRNITNLNDLRDYLTTTKSRLEILSSDPDPVKARAFNPDEYAAVTNMLSRYRQLILTDTGNDLTTPLIHEIMERTDTLVVPTTTAQDGAYLGWQTLDVWEKRGPHGKALVDRAVVVITLSAEEKQVPLDELVRTYQSKVRDVIVVPRDAHLAAGSTFDWDSLHPSTQRAYLRVAASIAQDFGVTSGSYERRRRSASSPS